MPNSCRLRPLNPVAQLATSPGILLAICCAAQNNANVINMSFDFKTPSQELSSALDSRTTSSSMFCAASAGNDGAMETVYPAALQTDVIGVASANDLGRDSTAWEILATPSYLAVACSSLKS